MYRGENQASTIIVFFFLSLECKREYLRTKDFMVL